MLIVIRFMRFDPATQVISGTPLRGDVNCRSDQWHPAKDRCREGGFHLVRLGVTDLTFTAYQEFVVHVLPNYSPLLEADKSFHWPTLREINIVRRTAQRNAYHLEARSALTAMARSPSTATVYPWTARDPAAAATRTLLTNLLQETRVDSGESRALIAAVRASGISNEMMDLISALEAGVRAQELQVSRARASAPSLAGGNPEGWMAQLQGFMENSAKGTLVMWQPAGGGGPGASNTLISGSGHKYGGFLRPVPGLGYGLTARRLNDQEMVVEIPTACWSETDAATQTGLSYNNSNGTETFSSWRHPQVVSCDFAGLVALRYLYLRLDKGGLRFIEAVMDPPDFPHVDLVAAALASQDLMGLVQSVARRATSYAKRWEEFLSLPARYEAMWQPTSSGLTIVASVGGIDAIAHTPLPTVNVSITMDVPHAWPWPGEGELMPGSIRITAADDIPYHRREAVASLSAELATDASLAGSDNQGGLAQVRVGPFPNPDTLFDALYEVQSDSTTTTISASEYKTVYPRYINRPIQDSRLTLFFSTHRFCSAWKRNSPRTRSGARTTAPLVTALATPQCSPQPAAASPDTAIWIARTFPVRTRVPTEARATPRRFAKRTKKPARWIALVERGSALVCFRFSAPIVPCNRVRSGTW